MKEQAGSDPGRGVTVSGSSATPFDIETLVVPPQQRLSMPVQRLEPISLRRALDAAGHYAPAPVASASLAPAAPVSARLRVRE